jgi:antitoxin (DNA-binding transcriptional repressor) of toxin-antitoxin stability system
MKRAPPWVVFEEILAREAEIIITRRGRPIARLTAMQPAAERPSHADLRAKMPRMKVGSGQLVRLDREERG